MEPLIEETMVIDERRYKISWFDPPSRPPLELTTQALGICFTAGGEIILVTLDHERWTLPGGTIEQSETLEQTLTREVWEEASARVRDCAYIGCQLVEELDGQLASYYQTRFWARVALEPFVPEDDVTARRLVAPEAFRETLYWGAAPTAGLILERGVAIEVDHRRSR
jgi:8-oxo-dGTP pyrophosphatase MutT (NUDIX family)